MHPVVEELEDVERLVIGIEGFARARGAGRVVLLGDQHHTHSVVRLEVLGLWKRAFRRWKNAGLDVLALVGNHDRSNDGKNHAMEAYPEITVVDEFFCENGILYLPHYDDPKEFVARCQMFPEAHTLVCHQLFDGATFENGYYAGEGAANLDDIPQKFVISGHIHKPQRLGKLWYVGAPRWRTISDANESRAIWYVEHFPDGSIGPTAECDTAQCCRKIVHLTDSPGHPAAVPAPGPLLDVRVDVAGPAAYVVPRAAELRAAGVRVRPFRTDSVRVAVRESEGIVPAFRKFLGGYEGKRGTPREKLTRMVAERLEIAA